MAARVAGVLQRCIRLAHSNAAANSELIKTATALRFNAVSLNPGVLQDIVSIQAEKQLQEAVHHWKHVEPKNAAWLQLQPHHCHLVPVAISCGFVMHRCQDNVVHMYRWLAEGDSRIPPFATHQVGVAGLCLNDQHEVLVVREKNAVVNGYKLPGGLADPGEDLARTAVREVLEETGVVADFAGILAFREQHGVGFGVSDLYYVCRCIPSSTTIQACADEIEEAVWMPMDDYCNQTSHMNAIIARCAERGLQLEPERLPCDIESIKLDSVVHSKRQFQLYVPSAIAKHVDLADPWHGQEHESIGLLPNASL